MPGGNWHYSDDVPVDTSIPSDRNVAVGDYTPSLPPKGVSLPYIEEYNNVEENDLLRRAHRAPKPIWQSLTSNVPAVRWHAGFYTPFFFYLLSLACSANQRNSLAYWYPLGWVPSSSYSRTYVLSHPAKAIPHEKLQRYLRAFASWHGVNTNDNNPNISYNTRVELVEKTLSAKGEEIGWALTIKELVSTNRNTLRATWRKEVRGHIFNFGLATNLRSVLRRHRRREWTFQCSKCTQYCWHQRVGGSLSWSYHPCSRIPSSRNIRKWNCSYRRSIGACHKILMQPLTNLTDFFSRVVVKSHETSSTMSRRFINQSG